MPYTRSGAPAVPVGYYWTAADRSFLAEVYPADMTGTQTAPTVAGRLEFVRIKLPVAASVTNIILGAGSAGATLTAGQCFAALFTSARALIGQTADQAAAWVSTGLKTMAIAGGPYALAAGEYYVGFWYNGTTSPGWHRQTNVSGTAINSGKSSPNLIVGNADTGLTTTAPATMGAQSAAGAGWWAALS